MTAKNKPKKKTPKKSLKTAKRKTCAENKISKRVRAPLSNVSAPLPVCVSSLTENKSQLIKHKAHSETFLSALIDSFGIEKAIKKAHISKPILFSLLNDKQFKKRFDEIINCKLELTVIDKALSGNTSFLTLLLYNRMPNKYRRRQSLADTVKMPKVIFVKRSDKNKGDKK